MNMSTFKTKAGWLTPYALACGYIELAESPKDRGTSVRLEAPGGPLYHVKAYSTEHGRLMWETFETLTEARRAYRWAVREYINA